MSFAVACMLSACIARADVFYDFETAATSPVWLGVPEMIQNTSASYQGTNAIAFTGNYPKGYVLTQLPDLTTNVEFYFYDDYGPNPPLYQYMLFSLLADTNSAPFAGFTMLDGGWGTTPPMTENHYYAWSGDGCSGTVDPIQCSIGDMGPIRTVGWHKFTFRIAPESVAMSVDDTLVFQTNSVQVARYLKLQCVTLPWGRIDGLSISTALQPIRLIADPENGGVVTGGGNISAGSQVQISAIPNSGWTFTGWSDGNTQNPRTIVVSQGGATYAARFTFTFVPITASYSGLFYDTNGVAFQSSGLFNLTTTAKGKFSAKFQLAGRVYPFSGGFSATGLASNSVSLSKSSSLTILLDFSSGGVDILNGQMSDGNWTAGLVANRAVYSKTSLAPQAGKYTLLLPHNGGDASTQPGGAGFGAVTVDHFGKVSFRGKLGDGSGVSQTAVVSGQGQWPLYVSLYANKGSILGWLTFANQPTSDIAGAAIWTKLGQPTAKLYPSGFTNQTDAVGSMFQFTNGVPVLDMAAGELWLADGNLSQSFTNQFALGKNSKVTSTNRTTLTISALSGLFTGNVVNPATMKRIPISGTVLQKQDVGAGYFLGTSESGEVFLGPVP